MARSCSLPERDSPFSELNHRASRIIVFLPPGPSFNPYTPPSILARGSRRINGGWRAGTYGTSRLPLPRLDSARNGGGSSQERIRISLGASLAGDEVPGNTLFLGRLDVRPSCHPGPNNVVGRPLDPHEINTSEITLTLSLNMDLVISRAISPN